MATSAVAVINIPPGTASSSDSESLNANLQTTRMRLSSADAEGFIFLSSAILLLALVRLGCPQKFGMCVSESMGESFA